LVGFDTTSRNPNRACIEYIRGYLADCGVQSEIVAGDDGGKASLWATIGAPNRLGVILAGHTDVVPVDDQNWLSDPFTLTRRDDRFYGRGSADMKGFIACALAFVPEFLAKNSDGCFHLALTSDEETDMSGAVRLTDYLIAKGVSPQWIWVGEPTGMTIVNQHKGVTAYRTHITGVSGHSGSPDKGLNAIELGARFAAKIMATAQRKKYNAFSPSRFEPPYTTFNLGKIEGGTAENIIAEHCEILWQVRTHPGDVAQDILTALMNEMLTEFEPRLAAYAPQAKVETCKCFDIPPFLATAHNPGEMALKRGLKCDQTHAVGFATEAGLFQKLGAAAVICGPGFIDQAHQPNEFIDKNQLETCVDLMRAVLLSSSAHKIRAI
jgi:acetylornithine deacetylase